MIWARNQGPESRARAGSISIFGALLLLAVAFLGAALAFGVAVGIAMLGNGAPLGATAARLSNDLPLLALCQLAGLLLAVGLGVLYVFGADVRMRDALELRPVPAAVAVLAMTAGFAMQFPLHELSNLLAHIHPALGLDAEAQRAIMEATHIDSLRDALFVPLAIVAVPALSEELLFRGLLLPALAKRHGRTFGLVASSVLFGAMHMSPAVFLYASIAGLVLGLVRLRTGSVLPCIALHGAFNAVPVMLPAEVIRIEGFNTAAEGAHLPLVLTVGSALVAAAALSVMAHVTSDREES